MRWDRFFEDLEDQLDSEWEAERAALDSEAERLRLSRTTLRERLQALAGDDAAQIGLHLTDRTVLTGRLSAVGVDWAGLAPDGLPGGAGIVAMDAVTAVALPEAELLRSARAPAAPARRSLSERMTLGFVLRDLARRRVPVTVHLHDGELSGTIDRALADHLDLALHEIGVPRRSDQLRGVRMVPYRALAWVRLEEPDRAR
ncbi:hypothetical protein GCM10022240_20510 [Microbacterium kribbense]|uniref:Fis family transcriptional regulator n=1 Tax=Microbacterium kribbense TaxID=433645 RepID=A0ABP7GL28_9MICO